MNTSSDRVQVRQLGELLHPGACALCGNGTCVDGYVDTSIFYDYEGTVYLCMRCVEQICKVVGALLPDETLRLKEDTAKIAERCSELEAENNELRDRVSAWDSVLSGAGLSGVSSPSPEPEPESKSVNTPESVTGSAGRKSVAKKSTSGRRPVNVTQSPSSDFVV